MGYFKEFIEKITNPYFEAKGYEKRKKESITYFRKDGDKEFFFSLMPYMSGSNTHVTYGVWFKRLQEVYRDVMQERFVKDETIHYRCDVGMLDKNGYHRIELEREDDLIIAEGIVMDIHENYAIPFYEGNSTLKGVLNTMRKVNGLPIAKNNKIHSVYDERGVLLELFLTKLYLPEEMESRLEYYKRSCYTASKEHEEKTGEKDGYLYVLDIIKDGIEKMNKADWNEIRDKLT